MARPAPVSSPERRQTDPHPLEHLTPQERAVYQVLETNAGRVLSRAELARRAGIADLSARRCDSLIVGIRRSIGADRVRTVRRRGWMLVA
ncbi:MAG: winged helix-turn-helix domain-containing protein [Ilumatobacter fluminis]|uniref:helix-turn-helix domain-containing protein n=1 Tax=Ilumatobacter fluminis TaxID=467091 RepID=UPI001060072E|nr:response regulator transcription factor [Ilumatobacter fluminis]